MWTGFWAYLDWDEALDMHERWVKKATRTIRKPKGDNK